MMFSSAAVTAPDRDSRLATTLVTGAAIFLALTLGLAACGDSGSTGSKTPDPGAARVRMARTLLDQGHVPECIGQLRRLPQTASNSIGPLSQPDWFEPVIEQLIRRRALFEADSLLGLTGPVEGRSARLQALSANLMVLSGDLEGAIATWAAIRTGDPKLQARVFHELATLYMMTDRPAEAENQAREGLAIEPDRWALRLLLVESLLRQGRPDEALAELQPVPDGVARWRTEARVQLKGFDRVDRALQLLTQASQAAPRNPDVRIELARAYQAAKNPEQVRALVEPLARLPVPFKGSRELLVQACEELGDEETAAVFRAQLEGERSVDDARNLRIEGLKHSAAGDLDQALELFDRALKLSPDNANLHNDRGAMLARLKRYPEAESAFREAEALTPEDPVVQENLARLYERTGETEKRDAAIARWEELTGGHVDPSGSR